MSNARIAIVYHSGYGHTGRQAEAVKFGVEQVQGAEAPLMTVDEAQTRWDDLAAAEAIIFGAPTYMASALPREAPASRAAESHNLLAFLDQACRCGHLQQLSPRRQEPPCSTSRAKR